MDMRYLIFSLVLIAGCKTDYNMHQINFNAMYHAGVKECSGGTVDIPRDIQKVLEYHKLASGQMLIIINNSKTNYKTFINDELTTSELLMIPDPYMIGNCVDIGFWPTHLDPATGSISGLQININRKQ